MVTAIKGNDTSTFGGQVVIPSPAFSVYKSSDTGFSAATWTAVTFDVEYYDTNSNYDTSTYKFTPTVEGYYQFNIGTGTTHTGTATIVGVGIFKNGSIATPQSTIIADFVSHSSGSSKSHSCLVYMNGTTDYIQGYVYNNGTSPIVVDTTWETHMSGYLVRAV